MSEPRLVLMTTDAVGGVFSYSLELASQLGSFGVNVALVVLGPSPSEMQRQRARRLPLLSLFEHAGKLEWMDNPWLDLEHTSTALVHLAERLRPDVVHLNGYGHGHLDLGAPKLVVGHSCVLSWWRAVEPGPHPPGLARYRALVERGLAGADMVAAPSQAMLLSLAENYGALRQPRVIANGVQPPARRSARKEPLALCAGRLWDRAKNAEMLDEAARGLPWPIYAAGPGERRWSSLLALGNLEPSELASWYARAGIYAHPARYEPFGLSVLEAALAGCALLLGDIPTLREIWGDAATYVPPEDATRLRAELSALMLDDRRRAELGERARLRACRFSGRAMALDYLDAYRQLTRSRALEQGAA